MSLVDSRYQLDICNGKETKKRFRHPCPHAGMPYLDPQPGTRGPCHRARRKRAPLVAKAPEIEATKNCSKPTDSLMDKVSKAKMRRHRIIRATEDVRWPYKNIDQVWYPLERLWKDRARKQPIDDSLDLSNWRVSDWDLAMVGTTNFHVQTLIAKNLHAITDDGLSRLCDFRQCLRLDLSGCSHLGDRTAEHLRKHFIQVRDLNLSGTAVGDQGLVSIFAGMRKLVTLGLRNCAKITSRALMEISAYIKLRTTLKHLDLRDSSGFSNDSLMLILAEGGGSLLSLKLAGCKQLDISAFLGMRRDIGTLKLQLLDLGRLPALNGGSTLMDIIATSCGYLTELRLDGVIATIDDIALVSFASAVEGRQPPPLNIVNLRNCKNITSAGLVPFLLSVQKTLTDLDISCCSVIDDGVATGLASLAKLERLCMMNVPMLSDDGLSSFASSAVHLAEGRISALQEIDASAAFTGSVDNTVRCKVPRYGPNGIRAFIKAFGFTLTRIDFDGVPRVDDSAVLCIARHCPKLSRIGLEKCAYVTDVGVIALAQHCPALERVRVPGCGGRSNPLTDEVAVALGTHCPKLRTLDLSRSHIALDGCLKLSTGCPQLESLKLNDCDRLTDQAIHSLLVGCRWLRVLNLAGCDSIRETCITQLPENYSYRLAVMDLHFASLGRGFSADTLTSATKALFPFAKRNPDGRCGFSPVQPAVHLFAEYQVCKRRENSAATIIETRCRGILKRKYAQNFAKERKIQQRDMAATKMIQRQGRRWLDQRAGKELLSQLILQRDRALQNRIRIAQEIAKAAASVASTYIKELNCERILRCTCVVFVDHRRQLKILAWEKWTLLLESSEVSSDGATEVRKPCPRLEKAEPEKAEDEDAETNVMRFDKAASILHRTARAYLKAISCIPAFVADPNYRLDKEAREIQNSDESSPRYTNLKDEGAESPAYEHQSVSIHTTDTCYIDHKKSELDRIFETALLNQRIANFQCRWRYWLRRREARLARARSVLLRSWRRYKIRKQHGRLRQRRARAVSAFRIFASPESIERIIEYRKRDVLNRHAIAARSIILRQRAIRMIQKVMHVRCVRWRVARRFKYFREDRSATQIQRQYRKMLQYRAEQDFKRLQDFMALRITRLVKHYHYRQRFRELQRQMAARKALEEKRLKQEILERKREEKLREWFIKGREKSAVKIQAVWREHSAAGKARAQRVVAREIALRHTRRDIAMSERNAEAKEAAQQLVNRAKRLASISVTKGTTAARAALTQASQALSGVSTEEEVVRRGYALPQVEKPKARERVLNFILDRKTSQAQAEENQQLESAILNQQSRSIQNRGIVDLAITVGKEELVYMEERNNYNERIKEPVFRRLRKDLSGSKRRKIYIWYCMGIGRGVLSDIRVRRAPAEHKNKEFNDARIHSALMTGTIIRGHEQLGIELHCDQAVYQAKSKPPIDKIEIGRNDNEIRTFKNSNYERQVPSLALAGDLPKYHILAHRFKVYDKPIQNTIVMGLLRRQKWWSEEDERIRKLVETFALQLDPIQKMRAAFDALNFAKGEHIEVAEWLKSLGERRSPIPIYAQWLIDVVEVQAQTRAHIDFGEYMALVCTICFFDKQELQRFIFKCATGRETSYLSKESFEKIIIGLLDHSPLRYRQSDFDRLFMKYSRGTKEIFLADFVAITEKLPAIMYTILRFQDNIMKANCGTEFWYQQKVKFAQARDRNNIERVGLFS